MASSCKAIAPTTGMTPNKRTGPSFSSLLYTSQKVPWLSHNLSSLLGPRCSGLFSGHPHSWSYNYWYWTRKINASISRRNSSDWRRQDRQVSQLLGPLWGSWRETWPFQAGNCFILTRRDAITTPAEHLSNYILSNTEHKTNSFSIQVVNCTQACPNWPFCLQGVGEHRALWVPGALPGTELLLSCGRHASSQVC